MGDVLGLATSGIKKTHIMYKGNLSYEQAHQYLSELMERGLVTREINADGTIYRTTGKGREFLAYYNRLIEFLDEPVPQAMYISM